MEKEYWCAWACVNGEPCILKTDCVAEKPNCCVFDGSQKVTWNEGKPPS